MRRRRKNKVGPKPFANKRNNGIMLLSDGLMTLDRRDDDYLQARRAVLNSYHLSGGHSLRQKMKSSLRGLWQGVGTAVRARVGVRVYRFTVRCPWSGGGVLVFRCFIPDVKCIH
ncbi:hypothetical protein Salat_1691900 [Sesamum alatum]|uniref:Uncharacterized protein n=1 Tax=Sesamum alatum TaxID=300844 RepID=A0AAE2CJZ2_9LAMI|nr:hypothetical protein Salat_1691900 [Sesamum alatum]